MTSRKNTLTLSILTNRVNTLFLFFTFDFLLSTTTKMHTPCNHSLPCYTFSVRLFPASNCGGMRLKVTGKGQDCVAVWISDSIFLVSLFYPNVDWVGVMPWPRKSQKNYTKEKTATDKRRSLFFYTFLYLLSSTTIPWVRDSFLDT